MDLPSKNLKACRLETEKFKLFIGKSNSLTIVVSKKVAPLAVDRNRMRRLVKEALRSSSLDSGNMKFVIKKSFADAKMGEIKNEIEKLVKNIN